MTRLSLRAIFVPGFIISVAGMIALGVMLADQDTGLQASSGNPKPLLVTPTAVGISTPQASTWTGNGSLVSHYGRLLPQTNLSKGWLGATVDYVKVHSSLLGDPVGFYQWQVSEGICERVHIEFRGIPSTPQPVVDIRLGRWSDRTTDRLLDDVRLPVVIGASHTTEELDGWFAIAVDMPGDIRGELQAWCTNEPESPISTSSAQPLLLSSGAEWQGTGSVLSKRFIDHEFDVPFGGFRDVLQVRNSGNPPALFYQWMVSVPGCQSLLLEPQNIAVTERTVDVLVKKWFNDEFDKWLPDQTLPVELNSSNIGTLANDHGAFVLVGVRFKDPVSSIGSVWAKCPGH